MFDITLGTGNDLGKIERLIGSSYFFPYRYIRGKEKEARVLWLEDLGSCLQKGARLLLLSEGGVVYGFILLEGLPWDSRVFGRKMGAFSCVELAPGLPRDVVGNLGEQAVAAARSEGYEFLLAKAHTNNMGSIHFLEGCGFMLVDTLLDFVWEKGPFPSAAVPAGVRAADVEVVPAQAEDELELKEIARMAFGGHFGRYHSDPQIPRDLANGVYEEWISSSLKGYADHFLVARIGGEIAGYSIWKKPSPAETAHGLGVGHYSIAGIKPCFQGRGLFSILTSEGMKLLEKEVERIEGPTHINNYPVQKGYVKLGWRIADARHSFHKWM